MAGIYIHIPFCKQACSYCNFHFSTLLKNKPQLIEAILLEIKHKKDFFEGNAIIETIYFGGGTPSLLNQKELSEILSLINQNFTVTPNSEITLEANPDDLTAEKLNELRSIGINRLSIGIQSFDDEILRWMNRSHNAAQALKSVEVAQKSGFDNISIDLIYGFPQLSHMLWQETMQTATNIDVQHISAYQLTLENKTKLGHAFAKNKFNPAEDDFVAEQFEMLIDFMQQSGFEHYEISNFAKHDFISKHNSSYWLGKPYLGIGPAAHSFKKGFRSWNVANNAQYIQDVRNTVPFAEKEIIDEVTACNEYILTHLRTKWGIRLDFFDEKRKMILLKAAKKYLDSSCLENIDKTLYLTQKGKMLADRISSDLFF